MYVSSSFSTRTSYENQTKKAITNKFVSQAMTDFLKHYLEVYFLEKPEEAQKICQQDRKSTRLNSSHSGESRMPSSA